MLKKYEEGIKNFDKGMEIEPTYNTCIRRIDAYREWMKLDKAIELCNQALIEFPDNDIETIEAMIDIYKIMNNENKVKEFKEKLQKLKDSK